MIKNNNCKFLDLPLSYSLPRENIQATYRFCFLFLLILPILTGTTLSNFEVFAQTNQTDDSSAENNNGIRPSNNIEQNDSMEDKTTFDSDTALLDGNQITSTDKPSKISEQVSNPDQDCLFDPSLSKCSPDENGDCPEGFGTNEDGQCFPIHDRCPQGYHSHEDDESGKCIPDNIPCDPGYIMNPSFPSCEDKDRVCTEFPNLDECKLDETGIVENNNNDPIKETQENNAKGGPYNSGYDHGCSDSKISDLSKRYINQPGKGAEYHTELFMRGYNDGYNQCMDSSITTSTSTSNDATSDQVQEVANNIFKIIVKVTNNEITDENGGIYVRIDDTDISKSIKGITFPAKETITKTFEFNSRDVPVDKGFTVEVVYGDDYDVEVYGVNSPSKTPEVLQIFLGEPSAIDSDSKFKINVQVTNNGVIDQDGHIDADIKGTNIDRFIEGVFPAKSTITKTFEFNSMDVPVDTGFKVSLTARDGQIQTQQTIHGINSPSQSPESVKFVLGSASKFIVNVQITNTADTENYGFIRVAIPDSEIFKFASVDIPAKETITKTFEFNSMDVPVGKGFDVNLSYGPTGKTEQSGINSPIKRPEIVQFMIP